MFGYLIIALAIFGYASVRWGRETIDVDDTRSRIHGGNSFEPR